MDKRLYRSPTSKIIGGVCGGLGEYFEVDPTFIRIIAVVLALASGFGILAYIVAWIIIPKREFEEVGGVQPAPPGEVKYSSWNKYLPGIILIGIGAILLVRQNLYWFGWEEIWPILLVVLGLFLIFHRKDKSGKVDNTGVHLNNQQPKPENGRSVL